MKIGNAFARVLTTAGDVYDVGASTVPMPMCAAQKTWVSPHRLVVDEPVAAITTGSCVLTRSGRTLCDAR
ncbi:hypothetical protein BH09MYX1_BH09MYX1_19030 [soil metagenome]